MRKKLILLFFAAVLAIFTLFPTSAAAGAAKDPGYTITDYDVKAIISEDNVYAITETIKVRFPEPDPFAIPFLVDKNAKHGIIRKIPINPDIIRKGPNGKRTTTTVNTSVSDVKVEGYAYKVTRQYSNVVIRIGSENVAVYGEHTYKISYKYTFSNDGSLDFDEVYFNILGTDWDTTIDHFTFSVTLPKAFDTEKLGFSVGTKGATGYNKETLIFSVDDNTVKGYMTKKISPYRGVTMRVELPQGYFKMPDPRLADWILMGATGLIVLAGILLFLFFGRDTKPVKTVEFHPPDGMNPAEAGYVYDGKADNRDVVALLIYWADKGYLTISKGETYELNKMKDMGSEAKPYEKAMFDKLFENGPKTTIDQIRANSFYLTLCSVKDKVEAEYRKRENRIYTRASARLTYLLSVLALLPFFASWIMLLLTAREVQLPTIMQIAGFGIIFSAICFISLVQRWNRNPKARWAILIIMLVFFTGCMALFLPISLILVLEPLQPICAAAAAIILCPLAGFMRKRTPKGREWLGKILGLRDFILLAERDRINRLAEENPNYFYHILPYAYVLNVTDKWAAKFESIAMMPPVWYAGGAEDFSPLLFTSDLNSSMDTFQSHMTSRPIVYYSGGGGYDSSSSSYDWDSSSGGDSSDSGGSGSSGGGYSGGGGGGGGGSSW